MTAYMDHKNLANEVIDDARAREITDGVHRVLDRIAAAEEQAGREAGSVRLLAATKTRDIGEIMVAIDAGVRMIGENRPQEVTAKAEGLARRCAERGFSLGVAGAAPDAAAEHIPFHLIGQLQSNKIGKVLPVVNTIESVDSLDLAEKISRRAVARGITVGVLLEVNESGEASKSATPCRAPWGTRWYTACAVRAVQWSPYHDASACPAWRSSCLGLAGARDFACGRGAGVTEDGIRIVNAIDWLLGD